jgi:hypothetical protein
MALFPGSALVFNHNRTVVTVPAPEGHTVPVLPLMSEGQFIEDWQGQRYLITEVTVSEHTITNDDPADGFSSYYEWVYAVERIRGQ